ncbi:MAG: hypothetical protein C0403_18185 [Desulfobacterium sp.]|nr:hypothetical protein [Desulfobacterium sp.]
MNLYSQLPDSFNADALAMVLVAINSKKKIGDTSSKNLPITYRIEQYERIGRTGKPNSIRYQNMILRSINQFTSFLKEPEYILSDPAG